MKSCPKCNNELRPPYLTCDHCPWTIAGSTAELSVDNRCAYVGTIGRCRFVGTIGHGMPNPGKTPEEYVRNYPPLYCRNHFDVKPPLGDADCERSYKQMPADFDYSTQALVKAARERFECRNR